MRSYKNNALPNVQNPDAYHGKNKTGSFFEGWYLRLTTTKGESYAFIIGISKGTNPHSFVQVLTHGDCSSQYVKYDNYKFDASDSKLHVRLDKNHLSLSEFTVDIDTPEITVKGRLSFHSVLKWPDSRLCPGSMGVFNHIGCLECYTQVCIQHALADGILEINGKTVDFSGAHVYMEKNHGRSFPKRWLWLQASHFSDRRATLSVSLGRVPFLFTAFDGVIAALTVDGRFYKFTTMNNTSHRFHQKDDGGVLVLVNAEHLLKVRIYANAIGDNTPFISLRSPQNGSMSGTVRESITAKVSVVLTERSTKKVFYKGCSDFAGVEIML